MTSPHHVGQTTKAEILIAHLLDTTPAGTDTTRQAAVILTQLQEAGWTPPHDPADVPPLRPERVADEGTRAAAMDQIRAVLNRPKPTTATHVRTYRAEESA